MPLCTLAVVTVTTAAMLAPRAWADTARECYKACSVISDGRIADITNGNVPYTEGQGFVISPAVASNDCPVSDKLWQWTDGTLCDKSNGLFYWRYSLVAPDSIADKSNASDGDTLIARALLHARKQWQDKRYVTASDAIIASLLKYMAVTSAGRQVMFLGVRGLNLNDHLNLNPSYFTSPAWRTFAERMYLTAWWTLQTDGQALLGQVGWGKSRLFSDWVALRADGKMLPAKEWPPRMSFGAIRIPLYLLWADPQSASLALQKV